MLDLHSHFIKHIKKLGYFYQCTDEEGLEKVLQGKKISFYIGFDCTAKSLHVGNLLPIMLVRLMQKLGHKPIIVIGGITSKVGDPSGKDKSRPLMHDRDLHENIIGIRKSLSKLISFDGVDNNAILLNNADWLGKINYIDFLREFTVNLSVNKMVSMQSVKSRLESRNNMSLLEFNYMAIQAYDFLHLRKNYNCILQIGGSDQWGNIITGIDGIKKILNKNAFGLTMPLLTNSSGVKMGKSVSGAVWLNEDMLTPYEYFQYWRNINDKDLMRFACLFSEFSNEDMEEFNQLAENNINKAKEVLAKKITSICHGKENAEKALSDSREIFFSKNFYSEKSLSIPRFNLSKKDFENISVVNMLSRFKITKSNSEAKRLIRDKAVKINNMIIKDCGKLTLGVNYKNILYVSIGKKRYFIINLI